MIYSLTLIACLSAEPAHCKEVRMANVPFPGAAVQAAAEWTKENPGWFVAKMRLAPGGRPEIDA